MSNLVLIFTAAWLLLASVYAQEFIDPNCNPEVSRHERVERIRFAILGRLNLDVAPQNPLFPSNISSSKMADFNAVQELNRISKATRIPCTEPMAFSTTKRVSFPKKVPHYHYNHGSNNAGKRKAFSYSCAPLPTQPFSYRFTFSVNLTSDDRTFMSSKLILLKKAAKYARHQLTETEAIQVNFIYKAHYYSSYGIDCEERRQIVETKIVSADPGHVSFDTTSAVTKWIEMNDNREVGEIIFEVIIRPPILIATNKPLAPVIEFDLSLNITAQFVVTLAQPEAMLDMSTSSRGKRQSVTRLDKKQCFSVPQEKRCCLRELNINFADDLGYTWISSPKEYQANYCVGLCPAFWPTASGSTSILRTYREHNPGFAVKPCCASEDLSPLTVLIDMGSGFDPKIENLPDMVLDSCICR